MDLKSLTETVPGAITLFFTLVGAVVGGIVKVTKMWRAATTKGALSLPPTAPTQPQPTNPFGHAPLTDPTLVAHMQIEMLRTTLKQAEWHMADLRDELSEMRRNMEDVARDQRQTAAALQAAQLNLDAAHAKIATLEASVTHWRAEARRLESERDRADARALAATRELTRCKQDAGSANSVGPGQLITPLLPKARE